MHKTASETATFLDAFLARLHELSPDVEIIGAEPFRELRQRTGRSPIGA